jgi:hypothetical protein
MGRFWGRGGLGGEMGGLQWTLVMDERDLKKGCECCSRQVWKTVVPVASFGMS